MVFRTQPRFHLGFFEPSLTAAVTELITGRVQSGTWALLVQSMLHPLKIILQTILKKKKKVNWPTLTGVLLKPPEHLTTFPVAVPVTPHQLMKCHSVISTKEQKDVPVRALAAFIQALVI